MRSLVGHSLSTPGQAPAVLIAACVASAPLDVLCLGAAILGGPRQRCLACLCSVGLATEFHVHRPLCELLTLAETIGLCPATYSDMSFASGGHAVLIVRSLMAPAFPAGSGSGGVCST